MLHLKDFQWKPAGKGSILYNFLQVLVLILPVKGSFTHTRYVSTRVNMNLNFNVYIRFYHNILAASESSYHMAKELFIICN